MVGSSIIRHLLKLGYKNIITRTRKKLDLCNQQAVRLFMMKQKPDAVINAAAKVGGILANDTFRAEFIYDNLTIQNNIIHNSFISGVRNLIFLGSSCIYPRNCKQPIKEDYLLTGPLEKTNEPYAIAKIAGIKLCESYNIQYKTYYKCLMPCNLYGPGDNYDTMSSHFFAAIISKVYEAIKKNKKEITLWGRGKTYRELMYVDDFASACIFFLKKKTNKSLINTGSGIEKTILEYAKFVIKQLDCKLKINFDYTKPEGTPRKIIDSSLAHNYGWRSRVDLKKGFEISYNDFLYQKKLF